MVAPLIRPVTPDHVLRRKSETYSVLEEICRELELTISQYESAKVSYEAVAAWLSASGNPLLQNLVLYAHGSVALGTTVRPLNREDFDVDLICKVLGVPLGTSPADLKRIIGQRLRENAVYAAMLEEKKRCWRLNYAREFHLDISPTVPNPNCNNGGELVPDKNLRIFKPTNPTGYRQLFERRCLLEPRFKSEARFASDTVAKADIAPFPSRRVRKGILRRVVQLLKRHRDIAFALVKEDIAPISIILTTLAAKSYEFCVQQFEFETELDVVVATIQLMPHFIDRPVINGRQVYMVANETTEGENFAERWNSEPERAAAFYRWHNKVLTDFEALASLEGLDLMTDRLSKSLGDRVVHKVMDARTAEISDARAARKLFVAPTVGLTLTSSAQAAPVPKNTHFGD